MEAAHNKVAGCGSPIVTPVIQVSSIVMGFREAIKEEQEKEKEHLQDWR